MYVFIILCVFAFVSLLIWNLRTVPHKGEALQKKEKGIPKWLFRIPHNFYRPITSFDKKEVRHGHMTRAQILRNRKTEAQVRWLGEKLWRNTWRKLILKFYMRVVRNREFPAWVKLSAVKALNFYELGGGRFDRVERAMVAQIRFNGPEDHEVLVSDEREFESSYGAILYGADKSKLIMA